MNGISLSHSSNLDRVSRTSIWILLILFELGIGATSVVLPPLYVLILAGSAFIVIFSIEKPYFSYILVILSLPFFMYGITGSEEVKGSIDVKFVNVATILAVFSWVTNGLIKKDLVFEKSPIVLTIIVLYVWMFFSLAWCRNPAIGAADYAKKTIGVAVFFLTINLIKDQKSLDWTFKLWVIIGLIYSLCGLWEVLHQGFAAAAVRDYDKWGEDVRTSAYAPGPNRYGFFLNLCLMIGIPQLVTAKSFRYKVFLTFSIIMMMLLLICTMSRGAWAGFFVGAVILSFYSKSCRKILIIGFIVAMVIFVVITTSSFMSAAYERFAGLVDPTITKDYYGKPTIWTAGLKMFMDSPVVGVGVGSFNLLSPIYGATNLILPHSLYVYILAEFGLMGLTLVLALVGVFAFECIYTLKNLTSQGEKLIFVGLIAGLIIYCFQGLSISFGFRESDMWAFFGLAVAAMKIYRLKQMTTPIETYHVIDSFKR